MTEPFNQTSNPEYSKFIALSRYARWLPEHGRRETWEETVTRYCDFWLDRGSIDQSTYDTLFDNIYNLRVMPSMRALMTAGKALDRSNICGFNCAFVSVDHPRAFDETLFILMNGTGVGFSVEKDHVKKLPEVAESFHGTDTVIVVADSKLGWAKAFKELVALLYSGQVPSWDTSKVRPAGAALKTFGGRASGPEPLESLFTFSVNLFKNAQGRKLTTMECHDLICKIADIVVVGGVRRSALISLSDLSDDRLRRAKMGQFWIDEPQRSLSNNSTAYTCKPDFESFMKEWFTLYESKSGERGIYNREGASKKVLENGRRESGFMFGTNPCGEIILRPNGFCNLSEVVVRENDTLDTLRDKVRVAAIIGTLQSSLTDFPYIRNVWKRNAEEECLLGVSLTGIMDNQVLSGDRFNPGLLSGWLETLKRETIETNTIWSKKLSINPSVAITTVKPSGTVSQLVDSASGIHERYSDYYIRTVRADKKDPLALMMIDQGFPAEEDITNPSNLVFSFPIKSPVKAESRSAIDQLNHWKVYKDSWCEHNPSVTIYYSDDEFLEVGQWVWENFDDICGISFLPKTNHVYQQAPYQPITEEKYKELSKSFPTLDISVLGKYELEDHTKGTQELACTGGVCDMVDLSK